MVNSSNLSRPNFINRSPDTVEAEIIALWEAIAQKPLFPAQAERLLLNLITYREALLRMGIQYAAEQNLVNYATGTNLDQLGELVATPRLAAAAATTTLQFTKLANFLNSSVVVPSGTLITTASGIVFSTNSSLTIGVGTSSGTVLATCTTPGITGNGFTTNQVSQFFSTPIVGILSIGNTSTTSGGADIETDDRYRARVKLAPERFSVAGSVGAYRFYTLSVSQTIIDASVLQPARGQVKVYPLTSTGAPSQALLNQVTAALTPDTVRPLTDDVEVLAPTADNYSIVASLTVLTTADPAIVLANATAAANAYIAERRSKLGNDIVRSQIIAALSVAGVKEVSLTQPAANIDVQLSEFANNTGLTLTIAGSAAA
ncbi:baseplate assembly protein [Leptolyngbya ohadii]|uniref:baseplate assembly protein n=1 Tax=Leptolyngbya ohadii TaxID=1962290 RepID=UPI0015C58BFA|nr:baseplate J/gp47 family protein [Leptolyngbya ohadii]